MGSVSSSAKRLATIAGYITLQKVFNLVLYFQRSRYLAPATQPDAVKMHSGKPNLFASRIFHPRKLDASRIYPLVILVHGGGFVVNNPSRDDPMARFLAEACECLVVSIDYSKAPQHMFPEAYEDVVNISLSVVDDAELPTDKTKVFLCGISAGGNLILAAAQDARLRAKVLGVIGLYPVCDAAITGKEKLATRPDPAVPDILESSYDTILEMYVGDQKPLEDTRLSPGRFAKREDLPPHVYLIGVEHDLLCAEARSMAEKLAVGLRKCETTNGWQAEGVRWDLVKGQTHGFDQFGVRGQDEKKRLASGQETYQAIADWLTEVFSRIDFARIAHKHGIQPPATRMRFTHLNTALGGTSKARKRTGSADNNDKNGSGGKKKAPKEGLEVGKVRTDEDEEDVGAKKIEEGAEIKKEDVSDEATENAPSPLFMGSPPDLAQQSVQMN